MALPDTQNLEAATSRTTGISAQTIAAGANYLGSEIDNSSNLDAEATVEVAHTCSTAATAGGTLLIYLLKAVDGTNYEDGDATPTDPTRSPDMVVVTRNVTAAQRTTKARIPLGPHKYKVLVRSELDQSASVTVLFYSHGMAVTD